MSIKAQYLPLPFTVRCKVGLILAACRVSNCMSNWLEVKPPHGETLFVGYLITDCEPKENVWRFRAWRLINNLHVRFLSGKAWEAKEPYCLPYVEES